MQKLHAQAAFACHLNTVKVILKRSFMGIKCALVKGSSWSRASA